MNPSPFKNLPTNRNERWELLRREIARWHGPGGSSAGYPATALERSGRMLELPIPPALREWYQLVGEREEIWSRQDHLLSPDAIGVDAGHLVFCIENQSVVQWGIPLERLSDSDPPVYCQSVEDPAKWGREDDELSLFALKWFVYCLKWNTGLRWTCGFFPEAAIDKAVSRRKIAPFCGTLFRLHQLTN